MRIALLSNRKFETPPPRYGGTERVVHTLAEAFLDLGHEVTVWARPGSRGGRYELRHYGPGPDGFTDWPALRGFDVVHDHWFTPLWTGFRFVERLRRSHPATLQTYHGPYPYYIRPYGLYLRLLGARTPLIGVQNRRLVDYAGRHGIPNVRLLPNPQEDAPDAQAAEDYLLFLSRLDPEKRVEDAIAVARRTGSRLVIAGPATPEILETTVQPHLSERISYVGEVSNEERDRLLARAKALVFPSHYQEGMPLVVLEALIRGVPVISSDVYFAVDDLIEPGINGFRCRSVGEMEEAVARVPLLDRRRVQAWTRQRFHPHVIARTHLAAYQELLDAGARAP